MTSRKAELRDVVGRFDSVPTLVYGDLILDHYIWGNVNRTSPEAPVVVVEVTEESKRLGGAGNVVNNLTQLGARVSVCGVVGDDALGRELVAMFSQDGVSVDGILVDRSRPTTQKTRVIAHRQQVVRIDREVSSELSPTHREALSAAFTAGLESHAGVIISDYAKGCVSSTLFDRIEAAYASGQLGYGKIPLLIDPKEPNFSLYRKATVIKPNRSEAERAAGMKIKTRADGLRAADILSQRWGAEMILITLGELGMVLRKHRTDSTAAPVDSLEIETVARDVFDVSGAGDTVSAVMTLALAAKATPLQAATLANIAAGIVVGKIGTVAVTRQELNEAIEALHE